MTKIALGLAQYESVRYRMSRTRKDSRKITSTVWQRVLKPGGRLLLTDPIVVTGPLTNAEVVMRSSSGFYLFAPVGYDEHVIVQCGMRVATVENLTQNMANVTERRRQARKSRELTLREIEGDHGYEGQQEFLAVASFSPNKADCPVSHLWSRTRTDVPAGLARKACQVSRHRLRYLGLLATEAADMRHTSAKTTFLNVIS